MGQWLTVFYSEASYRNYMLIVVQLYSFIIQAGHVCWDDRDILNGKPTGAIRISFGYMSTFEDVKVDHLCSLLDAESLFANAFKYNFLCIKLAGAYLLIKNETTDVVPNLLETQNPTLNPTKQINWNHFLTIGAL